MDQSPAHDLIAQGKVVAAEPALPAAADQADPDRANTTADLPDDVPPASTSSTAAAATSDHTGAIASEEAKTAADVAQVVSTTAPEAIEPAEATQAEGSGSPLLPSTHDELREPAAPLHAPSPMDAAVEPEHAQARPQSPEPAPHGKKRGREAMAPSSSASLTKDQDGPEGSSSTTITPVAKKGKRVGNSRVTRSRSRSQQRPGSPDPIPLDPSSKRITGSPTSSVDSYADDLDTQNQGLVREGSPKRRRATPPVDPDTPATSVGGGGISRREGPEVKGVRKKVEDMDVYEKMKVDGSKAAAPGSSSSEDPKASKSEENTAPATAAAATAVEEEEDEDTVVVDAKDAIEEPAPAAAAEAAETQPVEEPAPAKTIEKAEDVPAPTASAEAGPSSSAKTEVAPASPSPSKPAEPAFAFSGYTPWKPKTTDSEAASVFGSSPAVPSLRPFGSSAFGSSGTFGSSTSSSSFGSRPFASADKGSGAGAFGSSTATAKDGKASASGFGGFSSWATKTNGFSASKGSIFDQPDPLTASEGSKPPTTTDDPAPSTGAAEVKPKETDGGKSFLDRLQQAEEAGAGETEKSHLAMGGVTEADRLPGFVPQQLITGEEGWTLLKTVRCKLYDFGPDQNWHEAGTGTLRLLRDQELASRYRLVMRTDAVYRVILNQTVSAAFRVEAREGRYLNLNFVGAMYLAKFGQQKTVDEFHGYLKRCMAHVADPDDEDAPDPER